MLFAHGLSSGKYCEHMVYQVENTVSTWFIYWKILWAHGLSSGRYCEHMVYLVENTVSTWFILLIMYEHGLYTEPKMKTLHVYNTNS